MSGLPNSEATRVVLWIIYVVGVVEIGSAVIFCTLLAWDDFSYHRNRRRRGRQR